MCDISYWKCLISRCVIENFLCDLSYLVHLLLGSLLQFVWLRVQTGRVQLIHPSERQLGLQLVRFGEVFWNWPWIQHEVFVRLFIGLTRDLKSVSCVIWQKQVALYVIELSLYLTICIQDSLLLLYTGCLRQLLVSFLRGNNWCCLSLFMCTDCSRCINGSAPKYFVRVSVHSIWNVHRVLHQLQGN